MRVGVKQHVPSPYGVWIPWRSTTIGKLASVHSWVLSSLQRQEGLIRHATYATSYNELSWDDYMHTHTCNKPNAHEAEGCDLGEGWNLRRYQSSTRLITTRDPALPRIESLCITLRLEVRFQFGDGLQVWTKAPRGDAATGRSASPVEHALVGLPTYLDPGESSTPKLHECGSDGVVRTLRQHGHQP